MKVLKGFLGLMILALLVTGCAHREKFRAVEGGTDTPYKLLGEIEVHVSTNPWKPTTWFWHLKKVLTLGFGDTSYERRLQRALVKKAKKHFDVDQIINVKYWPPLDSRVFPKARVHARGEMIHYQRFPEPAETVPAAEG